uniref:Uncharacterized protein n=1 Tax=Strigamia maritima TaxID=126957 RepID=T1J9B6_STRMM
MPGLERRGWYAGVRWDLSCEGVSFIRDEASRILQVAMLRYMLRKALKEKQQLESLNVQHRRKSALRTVVVALLRSAIRNLQQEKVALPTSDMTVQRERAARRVLIALLRYQLARAKSRNDLLRSIPENLRDQDRWKVLLEREEARREVLLVDKLNVMNEMRTLQDERRALERMLDEERKKLVKAKEMQNRLKSDLESLVADKMELHSKLESSRIRVSDLELEVAALQASILGIHSDMEKTKQTARGEAAGTSSPICSRPNRTAELRCRLKELEETLESIQRENEQLKHERELRESEDEDEDDDGAQVALIHRSASTSIIENSLVMTMQTVFSVWYYLFPFPRIF